MTTNDLSAGHRLAIDVTLQQIMDRPFDAYAVIIGPPGVFTMCFGDVLLPGVSPIVRNMLFLPGGYEGRLLDIPVPPGVQGDYHAIVGLADAGAKVTDAGSAFMSGTANFSVR